MMVPTENCLVVHRVAMEHNPGVLLLLLTGWRLHCFFLSFISNLFLSKNYIGCLY